ncbi:RraA family protein [Aquabacter sp. CN5-332]|uniref:RraA family protein n=1 Tax=Aquabacter sp. CN5-332 TaxID=3156608 RepID=UPI0032B43B56
MTDTRRPGDDVIAALGRIPVTTVYEAAGKLGDVGPAVRPLVEGTRIAGRAFTVKAMPGDNMVVFRAIEEAPPGSVLVIDGGGTVDATIWGGSSTLACMAKGIVGCVTNAAARDIDQIRELGFPLYAAGLNVRGTAKRHPGWVGLPIAMGNATVHPGDIVLADGDGVLIVAATEAAEVLVRAEKKRSDEERRDARLKAGEPIRSVLGL